MSNFTKQVTVEEFWKQKYMDLADKYEALQVEYNAAAKQANMHPLLSDAETITEDTTWGDLDPDLKKLDNVEF